MPLNGTLALTVTSPVQTFTEPLTLAEVKRFLRLPQRSPADTDEDAELESLITAAREQAEILQNRDLVQKQYDLVLDYWPSLSCSIPLRPDLSTVDLVRYTDSDGTAATLAVTTNYVIDASKKPGEVMPAYGETWPSFVPWPSSAVLIRFTAGIAASSSFWADAGARIKLGMKMLIHAWHFNRMPFVPGVQFSSELPYTITACLSHGAVARHY